MGALGVRNATLWRMSIVRALLIAQSVEKYRDTELTFETSMYDVRDDGQRWW